MMLYPGSDTYKLGRREITPAQLGLVLNVLATPQLLEFHE